MNTYQLICAYKATKELKQTLEDEIKRVLSIKQLIEINEIASAIMKYRDENQCTIQEAKHAIDCIRQVTPINIDTSKGS